MIYETYVSQTCTIAIYKRRMCFLFAIVFHHIFIPSAVIKFVVHMHDMYICVANANNITLFTSPTSSSSSCCTLHHKHCCEFPILQLRNAQERALPWLNTSSLKSLSLASWFRATLILFIVSNMEFIQTLSNFAIPLDRAITGNSRQKSQLEWLWKRYSAQCWSTIARFLFTMCMCICYVQRLFASPLFNKSLNT